MEATERERDFERRRYDSAAAALDATCLREEQERAELVQVKRERNRAEDTLLMLANIVPADVEKATEAVNALYAAAREAAKERSEG
jgi:hypothetical protein